MTEHISDVFISYAHADDEVPYGASSGWVTLFVDELKKRMRSILGGDGARIWMDYQLAANDQVTEKLVDTVRGSRTVVLFMSKGYSRSKWCQKELGTFLEYNKAQSHKESVFIVELAPTNRESWHPRLQELTPIRFWREDQDQVPQLMGMPVPKPDQDDPYWRNLNKLAHLIAKHLEANPPPISTTSARFFVAPTQASPNGLPSPLLDTQNGKAKPIIWIAEPTDDLIDEWESLAEAIRQAGYDLRPLGIDTYPRSSEAEFLNSLGADLSSAQLFVQLLGQVAGRKPKDGSQSYTALQSLAASNAAKQQQSTFLQWRSRELKLENLADAAHRQLLTGAIASGFEEFRQRVLTTLDNLSRAPSKNDQEDIFESSLAICINANKSDQELGERIRNILCDLGADALSAPNEPRPDQAPTDFNAQLDEVIAGSEGLIIVYGQASPAWVQAQYIRARKVLAQQRKGVWAALLDGPPHEKSDVGIASKNLMMLDCRGGEERRHIERFVKTLREANHG
jgi:hypothetical protein